MVRKSLLKSIATDGQCSLRQHRHGILKKGDFWPIWCRTNRNLQFVPRCLIPCNGFRKKVARELPSSSSQCSWEPEPSMAGSPRGDKTEQEHRWISISVSLQMTLLYLASLKSLPKLPWSNEILQITLPTKIWPFFTSVPQSWN